VSVGFAELRVRQLQARTRDEIDRLAADAGGAAELSRHPYYACIGTWLSPEQGRRVLEVGCGPGKFVAMLASLGFDVTGIDPHAFPEWDLIRGRHRVDLREGVAAEDLPFPDGSFDAAACLGALLYFEDPERGLREIRRVVRDGGRLVLRTVNRENAYTRRTGRRLDPSSRNLYTLDELERLVEAAGFRAERAFSWGFWPPVAPQLWWWLAAAWLPLRVHSALSRLTPARRRINHVVLATAV
jgi:SAM-dependent methyltransferase